jgi:hypothetical protein
LCSESSAIGADTNGAQPPLTVASPLLNLGYNYDANQNVTVIRDDSKHQRELFQYDALDRLTLADPNNLTTTRTISGNQSWHHEFGYR